MPLMYTQTHTPFEKYTSVVVLWYCPKGRIEKDGINKTQGTFIHPIFLKQTLNKTQSVGLSHVSPS